MSGYREAPLAEKQEPEEMPDFRPMGRLDQIPLIIWVAWLWLPSLDCRGVWEPMSWAELWTDFVLWLRLSPIALVAFVVWLCLRRLTARAEERAARVRYERAQPRFDAPRNDIL